MADSGAFAGTGLTRLSEEAFNNHFQISSDNPMVGVSSRVKLLNNVGSSLLALPNIFGATGRPGNIVGTSHPARAHRARVSELLICEF